MRKYEVDTMRIVKKINVKRKQERNGMIELRVTQK